MFEVGLTIAVVALGIVAWLLVDPDRKQRAAAWLACGWVLPSDAFLGYITSQLDIWSPFAGFPLGQDALVSWAHRSAAATLSPWPHAMLFSAPLIVLVWRVVIWGWIASLVFPRLDIRVVFAFGVLADEWLLHFTRLSERWSLPTVLYHAAVAAACILPAQCFSRWTRERSHLPLRVWMHFLFHSMLLLGALSVLILSLTGGFQAPFLRGSVTNKLFLQLLLIPGVLLASAMREFYLAGGTPMPADAPLKLVTTGPYAYVANPMQIAKFGVLAGWAFFWSSPAIFAAAVFGALYSVIIAAPREDLQMQERFGSEWRRYRSEARRWWPRWRPYCASATSSDAPKHARLYLDVDCGPCADLAQWLTREKPKGLLVLPLASYPGRRSQNITYCPAGGGPQEQGICALGRAAGHIHLVWAFFGWMVSLPVISWLAQLIADVVAVEASSRRSVCLPADRPTPSFIERAQ
jgi:protein-S-isoprenylcysteine O-methyltransferase Ste14